jgi:SnoaL-like domain
MSYVNRKHLDVGYGDHVMADGVQVDEDLQRMLDERAITRVLTRYIRGVDRCDVESIKAAFHPDAVTHHGNFGAGGRDEFADFVVNTAMPRYNSTMHYISNIQFDFESNDVAYVETYLQAIHMRTAEINTTVDWWGGRFVERWEKRDGDWKIAERTVVHEWDHSQASSNLPNWRGKYAAGSRGLEDPVYQRNGHSG